MDRVAATKQDVASRDGTPDLAETDRALLADTLRDLRGSIVNRRAAEQLLHGEPHPGNVLNTKNAVVQATIADVGLRGWLFRTSTSRRWNRWINQRSS
jgi:predicted unusual protein kinase regulating ubiquinone biosynthesis (AarF/ABC1/UbiB family)